MFTALLGATLQSRDRKIWGKFALGALQSSRFLLCVWPLSRAKRATFPKRQRKAKTIANLCVTVVLLALLALGAAGVVYTFLGARHD